MNYYNTNPFQPQFVTSEWIKDNTEIDPEKATPEELAAAGYYLVVLDPPGGINTQLVYAYQSNEIVGYDYVISWQVTPFPKQTYIDDVNNQGFEYLKQSDWLVTRQTENGTEVPPDWATYRQKVRDAAAEKIAIIEAAENDQELADYILGPDYLIWPSYPLVPAENRPIPENNGIGNGVS